MQIARAKFLKQVSQLNSILIDLSLRARLLGSASFIFVKKCRVMIVKLADQFELAYISIIRFVSDFRYRFEDKPQKKK